MFRVAAGSGRLSAVVRARGVSKLTLIVRDARGRLVARERGGSDLVLAEMVPRGRYVIRLRATQDTEFRLRVSRRHF